MRWGRNKPSTEVNRTHPDVPPILLISGSVLCTLFFLAAAGSAHTLPAYPPEMAKEAVVAFVRDHATLADAIGINEYFPPDAVEVGAFEEKSEAGYRDFVERRWSFGDYMRDALRTLIGGTDS